MNAQKSARARRLLWILSIAAVLLIGFLLLQRSAVTETQRFKAQLAASGVRLDWPSTIPRTSPDEENFYATPIARQWLPAKGAVRLPGGPPVPALPAGWFTETPSLAELRALPAQGEEESLEKLRQWFEQYSDGMAELRRAGERPNVQLSGDYSSPELLPVPNYVAVRSLAKALQTAARVHLLSHDPDLALIDLDTLRVVMRALSSKPTLLVSAMIAMAVAELYLDVVQEGFELGIWKRTHWEALSERLERMQLVRGYMEAIESERDGSCYLLNRIADASHSDRRQILRLFSPNNRLVAEALAFLPSSVVHRNTLLVAQAYKTLMEAFSEDGVRYDPAKCEQAGVELASQLGKTRPGNILANGVVPNFTRAGSRCVQMQTRVDLGIIACAIESYRAERGTLPASLSALEETRRLPRDLVTGELPIYRPDKFDHYGLHSAGQDGREEGGQGDDVVWLKNE